MSKFYGFPVFDLPGPRKLALAVSMPVIDAEAELKHPVSDARIYDVVLAATGSEDAASAALTERIHEQLRRGEKAEV